MVLVENEELRLCLRELHKELASLLYHSSLQVALYFTLCVVCTELYIIHIHGIIYTYSWNYICIFMELYIDIQTYIFMILAEIAKVNVNVFSHLLSAAYKMTSSPLHVSLEILVARKY